MKTKKTETIQAGRAVASFLFPPVGIYTYIKLKDESPSKAKNYGLIALVSLGLLVVGKVLKK